MYTIKHARSKQCRPLHRVLSAVSVTPTYLPCKYHSQIKHGKVKGNFLCVQFIQPQTRL